MEKTNLTIFGILFLLLAVMLIGYGGKGCLKWAADDEFTITGSSALIDAPSDLTGTAHSDIQVSLGWQDKSSNEIGFEIERRIDITDSVYSKIGTASANTTGYVDNNVSEGTVYWYRVRSYNALFQSLYATATCVTTYLTAPTSVTATITGPSGSNYTVKVYWTDNSDTENGFEIERRDWKYGYVKLGTVLSHTGSTAISFTNTVSAAATYRYAIRAYKGSIATSNYITSTYAYSNYVVTPVDSNGVVGQYTALAVDANKYAHIAYYDVTNLDLKYVTITDPGNTKIETIDGTGGSNVGQHTAIALNSAGKPLISYYDETNNRLKCISKTATWLIVTVDTSVGTGQYTSIARNASDQFSISYFNEDWGDPDNPGSLSLATNATGSWVISTIDIPVAQRPTNTNVVGQFTSIKAVGNTRYISYYDYTNKKLKYYLSSPSTIETVPDAPADYGRYCSLALDSQNYVHISYYDASGGNLKYATNKGGWTVSTIDSTGDVGSYTSIAINTDQAKDYIYISYYDATNGDLKYAAKTTGGWSTYTIDGEISGNVGRFTSIAVDSSGSLHISYYDVTGILKYWTNR